MGLLDRLSAQRRSGFNASARGASPASGVKYFQENLVPGLSNLGAEAETPDAGFRPTPIENIGGGGGGSEGQPGPSRDLATDPLTANEAQALGVVQGGLSAMPFGGVMNTAIDFNLGQMNAGQKTGTEVGGLTDRSSVGYYAGLAKGVGMPTLDAWSWAVQQRASDFNPFAEKTPGYAVPVEDASITYSSESLAPTMGYTPSQVSAMQDEDQQYSMGPPASAAPAADPYSGSSGFGAGYDAGAGMSSAESDARSAGGDYGWADGGLIGPVGLSISGYAEGGEVQGPLLAMGFADGGPMPSMGAVGNTPSPDMINMQVNQMARNPQFQQQIQQAIQPLMQSGELTPQELQVMGQIAEASLQNPKLYPQLRQFVAQQGMSPLPPSFDPSVIVKILAITRALQGGGAGAPQPGQGQPTPPGRVPPTDQAQMQNPAGMANGGFLVGPGTGRSDSIGTVNESSGQPVKVANGEYVIPKHVVDAKGREFFDNLLRRYSELPKAEG